LRAEGREGRKGGCKYKEDAWIELNSSLSGLVLRTQMNGSKYELENQKMKRVLSLIKKGDIGRV